MTNQLATQPAANPMALLSGMDMATIDTDKLEKLLDLQAKWEDRQAEKDLAAALSNFQRDSPSIKKGRRTNNSDYASLDDIMLAIRGKLSENGLSVSFDTQSEEKHLKATCFILHSNGATFSRTVTVPVDTSMRGANVSQQMGSAVTYAKRYALVAALNLIVSDHDDDGGDAGIKLVSPEEAEEIEKLIQQVVTKHDDLALRDRLLEWIGAATVETIPADKFARVIANLKKKLA